MIKFINFRPIAPLNNYWKIVLIVGLTAQVSGLLFNNDGSEYATQTYLFLILPATLLFFLRKQSLKEWQQPEWIFFIALSTWTIIIAIFNHNSSHGVLYTSKIAYLIFLYIFATATLVKYSKSFKWLLITITAIAALFAWATLIYQFSILNKPLSYNFIRGAGRLYCLGWNNFANLDNPIVAGLYYGIFSVISLHMLINHKLNKWQITLSLISLFGLFAFILFTCSRGAWFSTLAGCLVLLLLSKNHKSKISMFFGLITLVAMCYFFQEKLHTEWIRGLSGRTLIWINWFNHLSDFWLVGAGSGTHLNFTNLHGSWKHAHSLYLQLWYEYGIVGICLFLLLIIKLIEKGWKCREQSIAKLGLALLCFAIIAMISDIYAIFLRQSPFWVVVWFPIGIMLGIQRDPKQLKQYKQ